MTVPPYLSRARLRRDASVEALLPLLLGGERNDRQTGQPGHHLVWSLFTDGAERQRDFLWREMEPGTFLILSARPPRDRHALFEIDEPKPYAPALDVGDRLRFSLRANAVVRRRTPPHGHSTKHDVVMDALHARPDGRRAEHRLAAMQEGGFAWLERQARKAGFAVRKAEVVIDGYQQHRIPRYGQMAPMSFSTLDFDGTLEVHDPAALLFGIARGFGAAKAYGCGLILVRRA